jgi:hypothetical protein
VNYGWCGWILDNGGVLYYNNIMYTVSGAILGGYSVLIGLGVLMSGGSSEPAEAPVQKAVAASVGSSDLPPSVESAEFDTFVESDAFTKFIESEENVNKYVTSLE